MCKKALQWIKKFYKKVSGRDGERRNHPKLSKNQNQDLKRNPIWFQLPKKNKKLK